VVLGAVIGISLRGPPPDSWEAAFDLRRIRLILNISI
jgi:hypothetical protein